MKEYEPEFDQMLFNLPLAGSAFKKKSIMMIWNKRAVSKFVPADDLIVPYTATSLDDAEANYSTCKKIFWKTILRKTTKLQDFYRDVELGKTQDNETDVWEKRKENFEGVRKTKDEDVFTLFRVSCWV